MAMAWETTSLQDLLDALRDVDFSNPPRPWDEFGLGGFKQPPKDIKQLQTRLKINVWFYRTNYVFILAAFHAWFLLRCFGFYAILAVAVLPIAVLLQNDSFATAANARLTKIIRRIHPPLAVRLRLYSSTAAAEQLVGAPGLIGRRRKLILVGLDRSLASSALALLGLFLLYLSGRVLSFVLYMTLGAAVVAAHAAIRAPNLKARFTSTRDSFVAGWKAQQGGGGGSGVGEGKDMTI